MSVGLLAALVVGLVPPTRSPVQVASRRAWAGLMTAEQPERPARAGRYLQRAPLTGLTTLAAPPAVLTSVVPTPAVVVAPAWPVSARLGLAALLRARRYVGTVGPWSHLCLAFVRTVLGLPHRDPSAVAAWRAAQFRHAGDLLPPAGVPVFWSGGGPGHVAFSMGNGLVLTSDFPRAGHVTVVPISVPHKAWHLKYLGWTEDLEGVRVHRR